MWTLLENNHGPPHAGSRLDGDIRLAPDFDSGAAGQEKEGVELADLLLTEAGQSFPPEVWAW